MNTFIPSIDPLPAPPLHERLLFEQPWPLVGALVLAGIAALVVLNRREQAKLGVALLLAMIGLGVAVWGVSAGVTTDRERVTAGARTLIDAAAGGSRAGADERLAADARLRLKDVPSFSLDRELLLTAVETLDSRGGVSDHRILDQTHSVDGPNTGRSRVVLRIGFATGGPTFSSWELHWRKDPDGVWRATLLECHSINGRSPGQGFAAEITRFAR